MARAISAVAVVTLVLFCSTPSWADEAEQASFHDRRAREAFAQERYEKALEEFFAVQRLAPSPGTTFNIGLCFFYLRRSKEAFFYLSSYLERAGDGASEARNVAFARREVQRLKRKVALVRVLSDPPGARVFVDRLDLGSYGRTPLNLPVAAGRRTLWLKKEGYFSEKRSVATKKGMAVEVRAKLRPIRGTLVARSVPPGAILVLDEAGATVARGRSPEELALSPGVYVVEASLDGYRPAREVVRVEAEKRVAIVARLERRPPPKGTLTITTNRPGALVEIGGRAVGFAPAVLSDLSVGTATIAIRSPGRAPWVGPIRVRSGRQGFLTATLEPPPSVERSPLTWAFGAAGASALVAAVVTGVLALNASNELEELQQNPDGTDLRRLRDQGRALAVTTDGLLIGGGITLGIATLLYFVTAKTDARASSASIVWE